MTTSVTTTETSNVIPPARLEALRRARKLAKAVRATIIGSTLPPDPPVCQACGRLLGRGHGGAA